MTDENRVTLGPLRPADEDEFLALVAEAFRA